MRVGDGGATGVGDTACDGGGDLRVGRNGETEGQSGEELADELHAIGLQKVYKDLPDRSSRRAETQRPN